MATNKLVLKERIFRSRGHDQYDRFIDFVVDGKAVREHQEIDPEYITPLIAGADQANLQYLSRLLGDTNSDLQNGRYALYVCPECQDITCGIVTAEITFSQNHVFWRSFAWQTDDSEAEPFEEPLSYQFDRADYERALKGLQD